ncbi:hypothetical protein ACFLSF_04350 [Candidatus Bipolaricaulota bacterium]
MAVYKWASVARRALVVAAICIVAVWGEGAAADDAFVIVLPTTSASSGPWDCAACDPVGRLGACASAYRSELGPFRVVVEFAPPEVMTLDWALERRADGRLPGMAVVTVEVARELSARCLLIDFDKAPVKASGLPPCDLWSSGAELATRWNLLDVGRPSYEEAGNWQAKREAIRIPGTSEYVVVMFEPYGIAGDPEAFLCRRTTVIQQGCYVLWHCLPPVESCRSGCW